MKENPIHSIFNVSADSPSALSIVDSVQDIIASLTLHKTIAQ